MSERLSLLNIWRKPISALVFLRDRPILYITSRGYFYVKNKGGDPAARSRTATLLRLHPNHWSQLRQLSPCG